MPTITLPTLAGTIVTAGPWQGLFARAGYRVYPYQIGCMVNAAQTVGAGGTLDVHGCGEFAANDYLMACTKTAYGNGSLYVPVTSKHVKVSSVDKPNKQLTLATALTVADEDWLLCLGADDDLGYDQSDISLYNDPYGDDAESNGYLLTGTGGFFRGWIESGYRAVDLLICNSSGVPVMVRPLFELGSEIVT